MNDACSIYICKKGFFCCRLHRQRGYPSNHPVSRLLAELAEWDERRHLQRYAHPGSSPPTPNPYLYSLAGGDINTFTRRLGSVKGLGLLSRVGGLGEYFPRRAAGAEEEAERSPHVQGKRVAGEEVFLLRLTNLPVLTELVLALPAVCCVT